MKITNTGFKLDYIAPMKQGESTMYEIALEEISTEITY